MSESRLSIPGPARSFFATIIVFLQILFKPYKALQMFRDKYGDPFVIRMFGMGNVVTTGRPELVKAMFAVPPANFSMAMTPLLEFFFGKRSLFITEGTTHRGDKSIVIPYFCGHQLHSYGDIITQLTVEKCEKRLGKESFSLMELAQDITLEVLMRSQLGLTDRTHIEKIRTLFENLNECQSPLLGLHIFRHNFLGFGPWAKFHRYNTPLREYLRGLIREYRSREEPGQDILSLLAHARQENGEFLLEVEPICDHLFTLLVAGFDTTANSVTWTLELIHRHPEVLNKILEELDNLPPDAPANDLTTLPWLDATCYEVLRLRPPVETLPIRKLKKAMDLDGHTLPAGTGICPSPILTHMNPDLYPNPEQFDPERFLGRKPTPFEFITFGGGVRLCAGWAFAHYQMRLILGTCLRHFQFEVQGEYPVPKRYSVVIAPRGDTPASLSPRPKSAQST